MRARRNGDWLALGWLVFGCAFSARADVGGTVTIQGTPNSKDESFYAAASCGGSPIRHTENWKIGPKGELQDVVVWMVDPKIRSDLKPGHPPTPPEEIHQVLCRYEPHVIAEMAGVAFKIINDDSTLHNIRAKVYDGPGQPPGADVFNFGQSYKGETDERQFDQPGIYTLQCDVHDWMEAWVRVFPDAPNHFKFFAVTGKDGGFVLPDGGVLADGTYKIEAWHPRFAQPLEETIQVKGGSGEVKFQFDGTKSF